MDNDRESNIKELVELIDSTVLNKYGFGSSGLPIKKQQKFKDGLYAILIKSKIIPIKERMDELRRKP